MTKRWQNRRQLYDDEKQRRFVVSRRVGKLERRSSFRYAEESRDAVRKVAEHEAKRLRDWPADKLAEFRWSSHS